MHFTMQNTKRHEAYQQHTLSPFITTLHICQHYRPNHRPVLSEKLAHAGAGDDRAAVRFV